MCLRKGKGPWIFCFNPSCPSRQNKEKVVSGEEGSAGEKEEDNSESEKE